MGKKRRSKSNNQEKKGHGPDPDDDPRKTSSNTMDPNDFISGLPNDILYQIISLLPFESAVQTTFLSTHWKDIWKAALLDSVRDTTVEAAIAAISRFPKGFDKHHRPRNKWGFRFELSHGRAILVAISSNGALQLDFSAGNNKQEFPSLFDLLLKLNLASPNHSSFRSMKVKSLNLISVTYPYSEAVSFLVPKFAFLQSLTIAKCSGLRSLEIKKARGLHKLVVLDCLQLESLSFEGSSLKSFRYRGNLVSFRFKVSCKCKSFGRFYMCNCGIYLEEAMLDFRPGPVTYWTWDFKNPSLHRSYCDCDTKSKCFKSITQSINGVQSLTLCRWFFETSMCKKSTSSRSNPEFYFSKLKELWWIDCSVERENIDALLFFLKLCPKLERLYVTIDPKCYNLPRAEKFSAIVGLPEELSYLKVVKLEGFADEEKEIFMARQLIPLFHRYPVIISKPDGTCLKHLVNIPKLKKKGRNPYRFEVVENVGEIYNHLHMNL